MMDKLKKNLWLIISSMLLLAAAFMLFVSLCAKFLIQKYDEKYTGRQITLDWVNINLLNGHVQFSNLNFYEYKSDTVFISIAGLSANINVFKLLSKTLKVSNVTIVRPYCRIIQRKNDFNFNDLKKKSSSGKAPKKIRKPFHFYIFNVKIEDGHFYYIDEVIPVNFSIKNVDIESKEGWRWDRDTISADVSFLSEIGTGGMKADFGMNIKSLFYSLDVTVNSFDLDVLEQYMKVITNYGSFRANFDANVKTKGCFREAEDINITGELSINDFHFGKNAAEDYVSFDTIVFNIDDVNPKNQKYFIDSVLLIHPHFNYERYDYSLDNFQTMFGKSGSKVSTALSDDAQFNLIFAIGEYIKKLAKNFFRSDFKINRLAIYNGNFKFNDYSIGEKFALELNPLTLIADSIAKDHDRVDISLESMVKPYGHLSAFLSINPNDTGEFDLNYQIQKIPVTLFNPYIISYTSFPLDKGTLEIKGTWHARDGLIQSVNHLVIIDPRRGKRLKNDGNKWLPVPLIMALVRENGNVIDYEIPITGNFNDPKFHLKDVIFDLVQNIFVKPATTPYRVHVNNLEAEIEKSLTLNWQMRQTSISPTQQKFIEIMAKFLVKNPEASITVHPMSYGIKEKEYILFYEAKKAYYLQANNIGARSFNEMDSEKVDKMSVKDSMFVHYLEKQVNDSMLFTIQEKCESLIDSAVTIAKLNLINKARETVFMSFFVDRGVEKRVKIYTNENIIPFNGFSYYKIGYKGEFPESITKAYGKMEELNDRALRKKLEKVRQASAVAR